MDRHPVDDTVAMPIRRSTSSGPAQHVVFDVETLRLSHEVRGGWRNIQEFGLAICVTLDANGVQHVWEEPEASELINYLSTFRCVVGFNSQRFDLTVLSAYADVTALRTTSLDLLKSLHALTGRRKGMSLQHIAYTMFGDCKSLSDSTQATNLWRSGKPCERQRVINYCAQDVALTNRIFEFGINNGYVMVPVPNLKKSEEVTAARVAVSWRDNLEVAQDPRRSEHGFSQK